MFFAKVESPDAAIFGKRKLLGLIVRAYLSTNI
jgi:hypothetical protein